MERLAGRWVYDIHVLATGTIIGYMYERDSCNTSTPNHEVKALDASKSSV
jgi:hypothetical protein